MGVVYLRTTRDWIGMSAIKALPMRLSSDADELTRFQREANVLASLNHDVE